MEYKIKLSDEASLVGQMTRIKELHDSRINYKRLCDVFKNLRSGSGGKRDANRNCFNISGWKKFFESYEVNVSEQQVQLIFNYIITYYHGQIREEEEGRYAVLGFYNVPPDEMFALERIALLALESALVTK